MEKYSVGEPSLPVCELVWPSGKVLGLQANDAGSIPCSCSPFSSEVVIYDPWGGW